MENIPGPVASPEPGVNAVRRSGEPDAACASPPPATRWAPKPIVPRAAQVARTHRELASTGTRSREFGKQTSDERIGGCLSGGALQGVTSREVPSPKEADTWWEDFLTTRVSGDRAKTVRRFSAVANQGFREKVGLVGCEAREGRGLERDQITVSGVSGFTPFGPKQVGGHGGPRPSGESSARIARFARFGS